MPLKMLRCTFYKSRSIFFALFIILNYTNLFLIYSSYFFKLKNLKKVKGLAGVRQFEVVLKSIPRSARFFSTSKKHCLWVAPRKGG